MGGIFGCMSYVKNCKEYEDILIDVLDQNRGKITKIYSDSNIIMGIQFDDKSSDTFFYENNNTIITTLSNFNTSKLITNLTNFNRRPEQILNEFSLATYNTVEKILRISNDIINIRNQWGFFGGSVS